MNKGVIRIIKIVLNMFLNYRAGDGIHAHAEDCIYFMFDIVKMWFNKNLHYINKI